MYQLIIHHDKGVIQENGALKKDRHSPGHVYLELKNSQEIMVIGILSGVDLNAGGSRKIFASYQEYIIHGRERLELAKAYQDQNPNDKILYSKTIEITADQYNKAKVIISEYEQYLGQEIPSEKYGFLGNNCAHFVNKVYRAIGLEGDYTRQYRESEIQEINTSLTNTYKTLFDLHPGDKAFTVFGSSVEEVAKKYNVDVSKVTKKEGIEGVPDYDAATMQEAANQILFEIAPNDQLIDPTDSNFEGANRETQPEAQQETQQEASSSTLNANNVINHHLRQLLSDPLYLKQYQDEVINDALAGLTLVENIIPGISQQSIDCASEHSDLLEQLIGIKDPGRELEKVKQYEQNAEQIKPTMQGFRDRAQGNSKQQGENSNEQAWLDNLLSGGEAAMHELQNDPDMAVLMRDLCGDCRLNPDNWA